jgi:flagellar motility protein MotE (MotC chaperone)
MNDEDPQTQLDEAKHEADEDLCEMEDDSAEMEKRLEENEDIEKDIKVPEPHPDPGGNPEDRD